VIEPLREVAYSSKFGRIDRDAGLIRDVKIIGRFSENNREYTDKSLREAVSKYEGVRVNIDHRIPGRSTAGARELADHFGRLVNVHESLSNSNREDDGLFGDLEFLKSHALAERVCETAERMPKLIGLSHDADGDVVSRGGKVFVESIASVRSVDLVTTPATTKGLFEAAGIGVSQASGLAAGAEPNSSESISLEFFLQKAAAIYGGKAEPAAKARAISSLVNQLLSIDKTTEDAMSDPADKLNPGEAGDGLNKQDPAAKAKQPAEGEPEAGKEKEKKELPEAKGEPTIAELQAKLNRLEAENSSRRLLEAAGVAADDTKVKALCALNGEADRKALVETWKPAAIGTSRAKSGTPLREAAGAGGGKLPEFKSAAERASFLRGN
jgi:hypothetical protein